VDKAGQTVDFLLRAHRDKAAARRYFEKAIDQNGECPIGGLTCIKTDPSPFDCWLLMPEK